MGRKLITFAQCQNVEKFCKLISEAMRPRKKPVTSNVIISEGAGAAIQINSSSGQGEQECLARLVPSRATHGRKTETFFETPASSHLSTKLRHSRNAKFACDDTMVRFLKTRLNSKRQWTGTHMHAAWPPTCKTPLRI